MTVIPLLLDSSLESREPEFRSYLEVAHKRLSLFTHTHSWEVHVTEPFIREMRVFATKPAFDSALISYFNLDSDTSLPPTYCAALEDEILFIVTPELYADLYPQGKEEDSYVKLIVHEIAHRLHIRILAGDEDAMGPIWFYEGLASFIADQFSSSPLILSYDEIKQIVMDDKRGDYRTYNTIIRKIVEKAPLDELIQKAKEETFSSWILSLLQ